MGCELPRGETLATVPPVLPLSHTPGTHWGWRFQHVHPLKQTTMGRKCVPLLQLSLYENRVLQGGSQRLLQDDDLKNSSNLIPPSILESERIWNLPTPQEEKEPLTTSKAPTFVAGVVMPAE